MRKRKVLVIGGATLFGHGVGGLLDSRRNGLQIEQVPTVETAIETAPRFRPDVVVFCVERDDLRDAEALKRLRLMDAYPTRIVRCTLDANHLTVYDTTRIKDATVEDLIDTVLRGGSDDQAINGREAQGGDANE